MDKIRALLEQLGSKELATQIIEALEANKTKTESAIQEDYRTRLEKAKVACLEEVAGYKKELARKMQLFFESRVEKIESQIAKQVAIKESAAEAKLHSVAALLEGVEVNGERDKADIQAALKQVRELTESKTKLESQIKVLNEKATRAHTIAEKTLERNKILARELAEVKERPAAIIEGKKPQAGTLTEGRKNPKPTTMRRASGTQLPKRGATTTVTRPAKLGGFTPESIADSID